MSASAEILEQTTTFLSEAISQPLLRRHLHSTFLKRAPTKPLTFLSQTVENAISSSSPSIRASSLRLAESLLLSKPTNSPFSLFLLSLVHHLSHRPLDAALALLALFEAEPALSRLEMAPLLFQDLFLPHFSQILEWYNRRRSQILPLDSALLSQMNGAQASALKELERDYEVLLEDNCRIFAQYFKQVVRKQGGDDDDDEEMISPPRIVFGDEAHDPHHFCEADEQHIRSQGFESPNRRQYGVKERNRLNQR